MNKSGSKTTLVMGASENSNRYSNMAIKLLNAYGHKVLALGKVEGQVDQTRISKNPADFINEQIDTVTLYLNPMHQLQYVDYILSLKPKRVIFNPGTENYEFENKLVEAGIETEEACTLVMLRTSQY